MGVGGGGNTNISDFFYLNFSKVTKFFNAIKFRKVETNE